MVPVAKIKVGGCGRDAEETKESFFKYPFPIYLNSYSSVTRRCMHAGRLKLGLDVKLYYAMCSRHIRTVRQKQSLRNNQARSNPT